MLYDPEKAFPYPVLREGSDDYVNVDFQGAPHLVLDEDRKHLVLSIRLECGDEGIVEQIEKGDAAFAVEVTCAETFYKRLIECEQEVNERIVAGALNGRVDVQPMVVTKKKIQGFWSPNFNSEFGGKGFDIPAGAVLALEEPCTFFIDREPEKRIGSVFVLAASTDLTDDVFDIDTKGDQIVILMPPELKLKFELARSISRIRPFLLGSVYLPVLVEVLHDMESGEEGREEKRWHRVISEQLIKQGFSLETIGDQVHKVAQQLLGWPMRVLPLDEPK